MRVLEGEARDVGGRFAVVVSRFNDHITEALLQGAMATLAKGGVPDERITVYRVPGAFEVPLATRWAADSGRFEAVIALSCVIRGGTPHFDYVCDAVTTGVSQAALATGVPVAFGVLTCDTVESAQERATGLEVPAQHHPGAGSSEAPTHANKGSEAALAAMEMVSLSRAMEA
jgi:6,7-dimethyl-8-ribityllumazine synthase